MEGKIYENLKRRLDMDIRITTKAVKAVLIKVCKAVLYVLTEV